MSSPCIYKSQLCNLPAKPGLASRVHTNSFSSGIPQGAAGSAKLVFCPACSTYDTVEFPALVLLKGNS